EDDRGARAPPRVLAPVGEPRGDIPRFTPRLFHRLPPVYAVAEEEREDRAQQIRIDQPPGNFVEARLTGLPDDLFQTGRVGQPRAAARVAVDEIHRPRAAARDGTDQADAAPEVAVIGTERAPAFRLKPRQHTSRPRRRLNPAATRGDDNHRILPARLDRLVRCKRSVRLPLGQVVVMIGLPELRGEGEPERYR